MSPRPAVPPSQSNGLLEVELAQVGIENPPRLNQRPIGIFLERSIFEVLHLRSRYGARNPSERQESRLALSKAVSSRCGHDVPSNHSHEQPSNPCVALFKSKLRARLLS